MPTPTPIQTSTPMSKRTKQMTRVNGTNALFDKNLYGFERLWHKRLKTKKIGRKSAPLRSRSRTIARTSYRNPPLIRQGHWQRQMSCLSHHQLSLVLDHPTRYSTRAQIIEKYRNQLPSCTYNPYLPQLPQLSSHLHTCTTTIRQPLIPMQTLHNGERTLTSDPRAPLGTKPRFNGTISGTPILLPRCTAIFLRV